jgi:type I restriction enzyme S subunit
MTWQTKKLSEVCELVGGGTPSTSISKYWNGDICWVTPKNLGWLTDFEISTTDRKISNEGLKNSSAQLLPVGSVILSSRAPIGYVAINIVPMATNQGCRSFICGPNIFNKYLYYFLVFNTEYLNSLGSGSTFLEVSGSKLKEIEIPLPPLSEQKKIVKILDEKMGKISEAKKLREGTIADTEKILSQALHEIFEEGKKKGWEEKSIGDVAIQIKSGFACGKQNEIADGIVHLRTHNISLNGQLNLDKIVRIPESFVDTNIFTLKKHDIIFNNTNSVALVGKTILIHEDLPYAFSNHLTRIRFNRKTVISSWVLYVFQTYWADKVFERMCTRWIGQAGINQTSLSKIKILMPPFSEQQKIVKRLDALSAKIRQAVELQKSQLEDLKKLEKAYLREAFNGDLV